MMVGRRTRTHRLSNCVSARSPAAGMDRDFLVMVRVEDANDLTVDPDRSRHPDVIAKALRDTLGNTGFAVSRIAEQKHPATGVDRWT